MTLTFTGSLGSKQPPSAIFPNLEWFKFDGKTVTAKYALGNEWVIAEVVSQKTGMVVYRIRNEAYSWLHGCPVATEEWTYYNLEGKG